MMVDYCQRMDDFHVSDGDRSHDEYQCKTTGQVEGRGKVTRQPRSMELALRPWSGYCPKRAGINISYVLHASIATTNDPHQGQD